MPHIDTILIAAHTGDMSRKAKDQRFFKCVCWCFPGVALRFNSKDMRQSITLDIHVKRLQRVVLAATLSLGFAQEKMPEFMLYEHFFDYVLFLDRVADQSDSRAVRGKPGDIPRSKIRLEHFHR
jgi:hypothetical protein